MPLPPTPKHRIIKVQRKIKESLSLLWFKSSWGRGLRPLSCADFHLHHRFLVDGFAEEVYGRHLLVRRCLRWHRNPQSNSLVSLLPGFEEMHMVAHRNLANTKPAEDNLNMKQNHKAHYAFHDCTKAWNTDIKTLSLQVVNQRRRQSFGPCSR